MPFLGLHFLEVIYLRQVDWNKVVLERVKPEVVIDEMGERLFYNQDPRQLLNLDQ